MQRELAVCIQREMSDTSLKFITISDVDVSPDLVNAKVFVTSLEDGVDRDEVVAELNNRAGHYRHILAKKLSLRSVPRLTFVFDHSVERGRRLSDLIDSVSRDNKG